MDHAELARIAHAMVARGRGILAADESAGTIKKRFDAINVESTEETRRAYRELLFTAPDAAQGIAGVILYDESLRQSTAGGERFAELLTRRGIVPGIKVDGGTKPMQNFPGEVLTEGLDGLAGRLAEYHTLGARFAKWRAVIDIGAGIPSRSCVESNADLLARYAALCQAAGIVPIVEPEVLMDGAHTIERCEEVTEGVLAEVFARLRAHRVYLEGMVLKPNMVISGATCPNRASAPEVAEASVRCLKRRVPAAVAGIAFLSGGQSEQEATLHLDLMHRGASLPWLASFSYGRALQHTVLETWRGVAANVPAAQRELAKRARLNGLATMGQYDPVMEQVAA